MFNRSKAQFFLHLILSCFFFSPATSLAEVDLVAESTFYKFDGAWLEISGNATNSVFTSATLYVRHIQQNSKVERLFFIPVNVRVDSSTPIPHHFTNTWTIPLENLKGKTIANIFATRGKGFDISAGSIDESEDGEIYVIYSDRQIVSVLDLKAVLNFPF